MPSPSDGEPKPKPGDRGQTRGEAVPSQVLSEVFQALSHPMRRQVLVCLYARGGVMSAGEIADRFRCSWPTTTRHLGVLESAGIVEVKKQGRNRLYSLRRRDLLRAADWIYAWAAHEEESVSRERPSWTELPYASMRNAISGEDEESLGKEEKKKRRKK